MKKIILLIVIMFISVLGCFSNEEKTINFQEKLEDNSNFDIRVKYSEIGEILVSGTIIIPKKEINTSFEDVLATEVDDKLRFSITRDFNDSEIFKMDIVLERIDEVFQNLNYEIDYYLAESIVNASLEYLKKQRESVINFTDNNLEEVIRTALNRNTGVLFKTDLKEITSLDASNQEINDISNLEYMENLEIINLNNNLIEDISVFENLEKLKEIKIENNNLKTDNINRDIINNLKNRNIKVYYIQKITSTSISYSIENGEIIFNAEIIDQFENMITTGASIQVFEVVDEVNYTENNPVSLRKKIIETDSTIMYFYAKVGDVKSDILKVETDILVINSVQSFENIRVKLDSSEIVLPNPITVVLNNGLTETLNVNWNSEIIDYGKIGTYELLGDLELKDGVLNSQDLKASLLIEIYDDSILTIIEIKDPNLEAVIREDIGKATGDIYVEDVVGIKKLNASNRGIKTLEGLDNLINLTTLYLQYNQLTKIEGFDNLTSLTYLDLSNNQLTKIEGLDNLTSLTELYLYNNQLTKIEGLDNLTNLTQLDLRNNQLTKIEGLDNLTSLTYLDLYDNQLTKIEGLDNLTNLTYLTLYNNQLTKIEGLDNLTSLTYLYLSDNQLTKIEGLDNLTNLNYLDLHNNQLTKIEGLDNLTNLTELYLYYNQLTKIEGLDNLTSLTNLYLRNNQLTTIEGLDNLTSLTYLSLYNNQLTKIEGLDNLTTLTYLDLYDNQLTKIEGLDNLTTLTQLNLRNNQLTKIEGLDNLTNLTYIDLDNNKLFPQEKIDGNDVDTDLSKANKKIISSLEDEGVSVSYENNTWYID